MKPLFAVALFGSSCTSICGSASAIDELDRNGIWVSSLDLNQEDSELLHLKDDADLSELDFPSPSFNSWRNLCSEPWSSSRNFQSDEPLFWPYDQKLYSFFELGNNFLCISPRKDVRKDGVNYALKPAEVKLRNIKSPPTRRNSTRRGCGRRIESTTTPMKSNAECKATVSKNSSIQGCGSALSRLSRSSAESSSSTRGGSSIKESLRLEFKSQKMKQIELAKKSLLEFEANCLQEFLVEGFTIEKLVGLDEFDGHQ